MAQRPRSPTRMEHPRRRHHNCPRRSETSTVRRLRAISRQRVARRPHSRTRGDPRTLARRRQQEKRRRRVYGRRDWRLPLARRVVRCVQRTGRRAAHGWSRPAHPARGASGVGLWRVCVFDGACGVRAVWCHHVWRAHDGVRTKRRRRCEYGWRCRW